jgi:hypothetical protein
MSVKQNLNLFLVMCLLCLPRYGYSKQVVSKEEIEGVINAFDNYKNVDSVYIKATDISLISRKIINKSNSLTGDDTEFFENKSLIEWAKKGNKEASSRQNILKISGVDSIKNVITSNKTKNIFDGKNKFTVLNEYANNKNSLSVHINENSSGDTSGLIPVLGMKIEDEWISDLIKEGRLKIDKKELIGNEWVYTFKMNKSVRGFSDSIVVLISKKDNYKIQKIQIASQNTLMEITIDKYKVFENISWPEFGNVSVSRKTPQGYKKILNHEINVTEISKSPDPNYFDTSLKSGYVLKDNKSNRFWIIGKNGEKIEKTPTTTSTSNLPGIIFLVSVTVLVMLGVGKFIRWYQAK